LKRPAPDKSLGQHFLSNAGVVSKIVDSVAELQRSRPQTTLIEVGPGPGVLTEALLNRFQKLLVIEIDPRMIAHLQEKFSAFLKSGQLRIHQADAAEVSVQDLGLVPETPLFLIGNLPYNVGTRILFHFLEDLPGTEAVCVMLQKEVVQRLKARRGDEHYGIPSVKCELLGEDFSSFWVSPGSFNPPPKVESGVLRFRRRTTLDPQASQVLKNPADYQAFFAAINKAFGKRRKMLKASFAALKTDDFGLKRPEELDLKDWLFLYFSEKLR
jgi:16S rRNA (adenine1518-N6/adenine1519-N6)-dimethyltransferase